MYTDAEEVRRTYCLLCPYMLVMVRKATESGRLRLGVLLAAGWNPESDPLAQLRQLRASGAGTLRHEVLLQL